jgi:60S ribosome subunit biogenesis protein NIP7
MVFEKLHKFIGKNIKSLIDRPDEAYCLRLQKNRVFYVREDLMRRATNVGVDLNQIYLNFLRRQALHSTFLRLYFQGWVNYTKRTLYFYTVSPPFRHFFFLQIARDKLIALGTCIGKFTHTGKFRLTIGCLDVLSQYAKYKVRKKTSGGTCYI